MLGYGLENSYQYCLHLPVRLDAPNVEALTCSCSRVMGRFVVEISLISAVAEAVLNSCSSSESANWLAVGGS